jgi:CAAX prenyl protease-like protein
MNRITADRPWLPYIAPMAAFLILTALEGLVSKRNSQTVPLAYAAAYGIKAILVTAVAWACRSTWRDLQPRPSVMVLAVSVALGLAVAAIWVGLDGKIPPLPLTERRAAFDPGQLPATARAAFLAVRFYGLVLMVPLVEELFWRSFLVRWIAHQDFRQVPIGRVTPLAAVVTAGLFALAHPEWLPALITGFLWVGLLRWSKSVAACFVSHVVANLALGGWILARGAWHLW